jgi:uncharacterized phage protein (TIGR01671 family)
MDLKNQTHKREIKFRVWDNQSDFYWGQGEGMDFKKIAFNFYDSLFEECRLVFQQYTGLLDKNGVEIYEGDIVKATSDQYTNENFIGKVIFDEGYFCTWVNENDIRGIWGDDNIEVIGNIFENKDLLVKEQ